jgi:hypothetical protein
VTQRSDDEQDWEAVVPYTGPPSYQDAYRPPLYAPPAYGPPPGWAPPQPWSWAPTGPAGPPRPGTTIAAAVLAFVLAVLSLFGTVYAMVFSALVAVTRSSAGGLGPWIALVQLAVVGALVAGGVLVLQGRRTWLLAAAAATVALAVYWAVVLSDASLPGLGDELLAVPVVFGVLAALSVGLAGTPAARAWERHRSSGRAAAGG